MKATIGLTLIIFSFLRSQCLQPGFSPGQIYKSTGLAALDTKFNQEGNLIYNVFKVNPNMFIFDDGQSPNAFAMPKTTVVGYFGTVYFGIGLLKEELWDMGKGEHAVAGIMAHEFAHILQVRNNCSLEGQYRELHADYMAGYYLGRKQYIAPVDIESFTKSLYEKGDFDFWSQSHHGTPEERVLSMKEGFNNANKSLHQAYSDGLTFVMNINADETESNNEEDQTKEDVSDDCIELQISESYKIKWHPTIDNPTVDFILPYKNSCDRKTNCLIKIQCGNVPNDAESGNYDDFKVNDEKVFTFILEPNKTKTLRGTLNWIRPAGTMPRIRKIVKATYVE